VKQGLSVIPCQSAHQQKSNKPSDNTCWTAFVSSMIIWCKSLIYAHCLSESNFLLQIQNHFQSTLQNYLSVNLILSENIFSHITDLLYWNISNFSFNIVFQFLQRMWTVHMNYVFQCPPQTIIHRFKSGDLGGYSPQVINHLSNTSSRVVTHKCAAFDVAMSCMK
jgi:site-specific recombinase